MFVRFFIVCGLISTAMSVVIAVTAPGQGARPHLADREVSRAVPSGPNGLDKTGETLPDTSYPIPSDAIFIATQGDDAATGSRKHPVKTLNRAIALAPDGGTIVFRGGVYRDWHNGDSGPKIVAKDLIFQAAPHEEPWLDGTDEPPVSRWKKAGDRWVIDWSTPTFCGGAYYSRPLASQSVQPNSGPCAHHDMSDNPSNPMANDPQMAFADGKPLKQVKSLDQLTEQRFHYDWNKRQLSIGLDPARHSIELTKRPAALVLGGDSKYVIRGIGFQRYGSNEYSNLTSGAVYVGGSQIKLENTIFRHNAAGGLTMSSPRDGTSVRDSVFSGNGYTALNANGSAGKNKVNDLVIADSIFFRNNAERFGENCTVSCGQAAIKMGHMDGFAVVRNLVQETQGTANGIWCDLDCRGGRYVYNAILDNEGSGIFHEVSDGGIIAANFITGGQYGVNVASANTKVYNNTLVDNVQGIKVYDDRRTAGVDGWDDVGPDTRNVAVENNIVVGDNFSLVTHPMRVGQRAPNTSPHQYFHRLSHNAFHQSNGKSPIFVYWRAGNGDIDQFRSAAAFRKKTQHGDGDLWVSGQQDPFFVDRAAGDFRVSNKSAAYHASRELPGDVARSLGIEKHVPLSFGAFTVS